MSAVQEVTTHADIELSKLTLDDRCQLRERLNGEVITEYCEAYKECSPFPAITCFFDGQTYWLADGFHRVHGAKLAGLTKLPAMVVPGEIRDAILFAASANASHGLRRTNADKRKAIKTLLLDSVWAKWSNRKIARAACVTDKTVQSVRLELESTIPGFGRQLTRLAERSDGSIYEVSAHKGPAATGRTTTRSTGASIGIADMAACLSKVGRLLNRLATRSTGDQKGQIVEWLRGTASKIEAGIKEV